MEIRKVQKTGDMHYVYLPTAWCKKHGIRSTSTVSIEENSAGALLVHPRNAKKELRPVRITIDDDDQDIINKLIMACYINPLDSFRINLKKELDVAKLLHQKNIISLESVEIDKKVIYSDSAFLVTAPELLLKTMVKKIKNLVVMMASTYNADLIVRYEEEIDRTKILIEKSIISYMTMSSTSRLRMVDLYYISLIARDLERMVDHLIRLDEKNKVFVKRIEGVFQVLKDNLESVDMIRQRLELDQSLKFLKKLKTLGKVSKKDKAHYDKRRIIGLLFNISEVLMDWAITNKID